MARKIFGGITSNLGSAVFCAAIGIVLSACDVSVSPADSSSNSAFNYNSSILAYTQSLAVISSALEDFESGAGTTSAICVSHSYDCANRDLINTFTSCSNSENSQLSGKTELQFSTLLACTDHQSHLQPPALNVLTKYYISPYLTRSEGGLVMSVGASGRVTASYAADDSGNSLALDQIDRKLEGRFEFQIYSPTQLLFKGNRAAGTRQIISGQIQARELVGMKNTDLNFFQVKWTRSDCCYPTRGTIFATSSGQSESLAFKDTCGHADFTDKDGNVSDLSLLGACE